MGLILHGSTLQIPFVSEDAFTELPVSCLLCWGPRPRLATRGDGRGRAALQRGSRGDLRRISDRQG
eukprot:7110687-Alexandrium_andersonii.AAC.1